VVGVGDEEGMRRAMEEGFEVTRAAGVKGVDDGQGSGSQPRRV